MDLAVKYDDQTTSKHQKPNTRKSISYEGNFQKKNISDLHGDKWKI